jgi:surface protein
MEEMFGDAISFNQNISDWDVSNVQYMSFMLNGAALSTANYDSLLIEWEKLSVQDDVSFGASGCKYTPGGAAETARTNLINDHGWTFDDSGPVT